MNYIGEKLKASAKINQLRWKDALLCSSRNLIEQVEHEGISTVHLPTSQDLLYVCIGGTRAFLDNSKGQKQVTSRHATVRKKPKIHLLNNAIHSASIYKVSLFISKSK